MSGLRKRQNVFELGGDWADPVLWYARGVKAMKARKLEDPTSWTFYAAIHGIFRTLWNVYQATNPTDANPSAADTATYLDQCQHQSWYFLPWHRGYLLAVENMIRQEIKVLNGPHETWALPYWNYFAKDQNVLPPAFLTKDWPDGSGNNPLYVEQRYGEIVKSAPFDILSVTSLDSMSNADFFGPGGGISAGFGGPVTGFNWNSGTNGGVESDPHNQIHGLVGGGHPTLTFSDGTPLPGLMSDPRAAALDPIFYLHHCNLDRLWESWNKFPIGKPSRMPTDWQNPTIPLWLQGPLNVGQREFAMPNPDKSKLAYTPAQMQDVAELGYEYDSLEPGAVVLPDVLASRMETLGIPAKIATEAGVQSMAQGNAEMLGASEVGISLAGSAAMRTSVRTVPGLRAKVAESLSGATQSTPDRVFLNLENVTGSSDAVIVRVYVGLPAGADPASNKAYFAGSIALFGVSQASDPNGPHAGNGITYTLEISKIIDKLHLAGDFDVDDLSVDFVPLRDIPAAANIKIGRISLYRQFQ